jgi:hypothetical protein
MKFVLKLFGRADGGYPALDVMIGDAEKILGFWAMPPLTDAGIFSFALDGAIRPLHFKGIVAGYTRFRPPLFTLEKNGIIFSTFGFYGDLSGLIIRFFSAGCPLGGEFLELTGSIGVNGFFWTLPPQLILVKANSPQFNKAIIRFAGKNQ